MKVIQFIGTKDKADFTLFFAHVLSEIGKRVLIIDGTEREVYKYGYIENSSDRIADIGNVEVVVEAHNIETVNSVLRANSLSMQAYDCVIIDVDSVEGLIAKWPNIDERYYLSCDERYCINKDTKLLHHLLDITDNADINRLHFESTYNIKSEYVDHLIQNRANWSFTSYNVEFDDLAEQLKLQLQHEQIIPLKKLSKTTKAVIKRMIVDLYEDAASELDKVIKPPFRLFNSKNQTNDKEYYPVKEIIH
ncbi:hypothetical protein [Rummeliibacillus stabekisii]|uniref:hypothetical protein n=1 Tax=Rummeliibacillus stabekisii TaxID=241244 RepID=UPI001175A8E0|nr:hypothetical protein [Rummeliibacillus stabekisii]MBB5171586.1 hypothetical protein [Rummeliibacillus stabekisii]GEL05554.1 hypothetical protein RST01_21810 [Rummeliibacillus stabekisii]